MRIHMGRETTQPKGLWELQTFANEKMFFDVDVGGFATDKEMQVWMSWKRKKKW
jgi:hypothetical protein